MAAAVQDARAAGMEPHEAEVRHWLANFCLTPEGRRFTFDRRPWLDEIAVSAVTDPLIVLEKASQLGMTVLFVLATIYGLIRQQFEAGAIYYFPTDNDVRDLSKAKVAPMLQSNYFSQYIGDTDDVRLKRIRDAYLYLRGTQSQVGMKAISGDVVLFDEADDIPDEALEMSRERIHASPLKWERQFSTPTVPGYGIDRAFQDSDQRYWTFRCRDCRRDFDLETTFPKCLRERDDGRVERCCPHCGQVVEIEQGRWVARRPGARAVGFHISQLISPTIDPADLLLAHRTTRRIARFQRGRLGQPFVVGGGRVTREQVLACRGEQLRADHSGDGTVVGFDVGRLIHWTAAAPQAGRKPRIVGMGTEEDFDRLHQRLLDLNCKRWVGDALPETNAMLKLAKRWRPKGHLCWYGGAHKGPPKFSEDAERKYLRVDCNRTDTLDEVLSVIREGRVETPKDDSVVEEWADHIAALIRTEEEDEETGEVRNVYVHGGPDHYAHSFNYCLLAMIGFSGPIRSQVFW